MIRLDLLKLLVKNAKEYRKKAKKSLAVNHHMNFIGKKISEKKYRKPIQKGLEFDEYLKQIILEQKKLAIKEVNKIYSQDMVDAILVDFINYVAACQMVDYALYAKHLKEK